MNQQLNNKYTLYPGKFICHTCKGIVATARMYKETQELTWMCAEKHLSRVSFNIKGY